MESVENGGGDTAPLDQGYFGDQWVPTEVAVHIQSLLNVDDAIRLSASSREWRDLYEKYSPLSKDSINKITQQAKEQNIFEESRKCLLQFMESHKLVTIPDLLGKLDNQDIIEKIYTQERVFKQFGGKDVASHEVFQRFKEHVLYPESLAIDLYIHVCSPEEKYMELVGFNIKYLSPEIGKFKNITSLNLMDNELQWLPGEVGGLTQLTTLWLNKNAFRSLPLEIIKLKELEFLELARNNLEFLPLELAELANLKHLNVSANNLLSIPPEICKLPQLSVFYSADNSNLDLMLDCWQALYMGQNLYDITLERTKVPSAFKERFNDQDKMKRFKVLVLKYIKRRKRNYNPQIDNGDIYKSLPELVQPDG